MIKIQYIRREQKHTEVGKFSVQLIGEKKKNHEEVEEPNFFTKGSQAIS